MNAYWYEKTYSPHKPYTPHLLTMQVVEGPGWVKVSHKTPEALEPLCIAMREAASNPKATYPELEILLRRLASSCGALVHRKGGISHGAQIEFKYAMLKSFFDEAGLDYGLISRWDIPHSIKAEGVWTLIQDYVRAHCDLAPHASIPSVSNSTTKKYLPPQFCETGLESVKRRAFSSWCYLWHRVYGENFPSNLEEELQALLPRDTPYRVRVRRDATAPYTFITLWYLASLDASGKLVKHDVKP